MCREKEEAAAMAERAVIELQSGEEEPVADDVDDGPAFGSNLENTLQTELFNSGSDALQSRLVETAWEVKQQGDVHELNEVINLVRRPDP